MKKKRNKLKDGEEAEGQWVGKRLCAESGILGLYDYGGRDINE